MRRETGGELPVLVWQFDAPVRVISSAPFGGGLATRSWLLNAQVPIDYARTDLAAHIADIAAMLALTGDGVGMLTAADITRAQHAHDDEADVCVTVGVRLPTFAAAPTADCAEAVGTINIVAWLPVPLSPSALVNAVATITEAKVQALFEAGVPGTGTATDAVVIACPDHGAEEPFGGPRSTWGARLARAVHAAVAAGLPS